MGANVSSQAIESTSKIVTNAMTHISTNITNKTNTQLKSNQRISVKFKRVQGCSYHINQRAKLTGSVMMNNTAELANDVSNAIKSSIKETLSNELKQANKGLNIGAMNASKARMISDTFIENNLTNIIGTEIQNLNDTGADGIQRIELEFEDISCRPGQSINVDQDMLIELASKNISNTLVNNVLKNILDSGIEKDMKNKLDQKNAGLLGGGFVGLFLLAAAGLYIFSRRNTMITIVSLVIIFIIILLLYFFVFLPKKEKNDEKYDTDYLYKEKIKPV